jgi:glutamate carboxypeptidase
MNAQEFLNYFESRQHEALSRIRHLCRIESPSYDILGSKEAVDYLEDEANEIGAVDSTERIFADGFGEHLIVRAFENAGTDKQILLIGHTDTVHPRGSLEARPYRVDGDRVYAPGIFDMKSGCIMILEVLAAFNHFGVKPKRPITAFFACDEEVGSESGRPIVEREAERSDYCLVFEPSLNGKVKTGRKGVGMFTVKAQGVPAHAGLEPHKGASAILELARQVPILHGLNEPEHGTTANVCTMQGGTTTNVIPEFAELTVDVRFTKASEAERLESAIKGLSPADERVKIDILGTINRPPMERTADVVSLFEKARGIGASFGYELGETQVGGASDGNFVGAMGVPVLDGMGLKGDGAHTNFEYICASDFVPRATLIALLLLDL